MDKYTDHLGRPIVAITGAGVVSSLGQGKAENWEKLTNGVSGIHTITRFPIDGLNTQIAGTVDFFDESKTGASALSEKLATVAASEAIEQAGLEISNFGGPLFLAAPPVELDWKSRFALDAELDQSQAPSYAMLLAACSKKSHED
ncbi:MAG: beta-ketoacyl-ACP synthase, partial [Bartonella sp.]|nr:beta-ketoacyl-ACP synthase [Bartonella sp.]